MTDTLTASPPASLRGPLLAAHRALRQSVNAACARCKGRGTTASMQLRRDRDDLAARDAMLRAVHQAKVLQDALAEFGGPQQIPQQVQLRLAQSTAALEATSLQDATAPQRRQAANQAQAQFDAHAEFAALFAAAFATVQSRLGT